MRLFLLMLIVTTIEVILIAKVGSAIGFFPTFILIVFTAFVGSALLKKQWRFVMGKMQNLQSEPSQALLEALILVICGVLLITPGFLTDIIGFLGLVPTLRERFVSLLRRHSSRFMRGSFHMQTSSYHTADSATPHDTRQAPDRHHNDVIEGEFERKDD